MVLIDRTNNCRDTYQLGDVFADIIAVLVGLLAECNRGIASEILASCVNISDSSTVQVDVKD
jgi:hypothetical protein